MSACQDTPNQYNKADINPKTRNSREVKSEGMRADRLFEKPNNKFIQDLKKKIGPNKYKNIKRKRHNNGKRSKKKLKKRNSETKKIDPGKPKNIRVLTSAIRKSLGHIKLRPLISVISLVLNRRATASTNRKEFAESKA
jgi:hypothetical protein